MLKKSLRGEKDVFHLWLPKRRNTSVLPKALILPQHSVVTKRFIVNRLTKHNDLFMSLARVLPAQMRLDTVINNESEKAERVGFGVHPVYKL